MQMRRALWPTANRGAVAMAENSKHFKGTVALSESVTDHRYDDVTVEFFELAGFIKWFDSAKGYGFVERIQICNR